MPGFHIKPLPVMTPDYIAKFWSLVDILSADNCWEWKGCRSRYGRFMKYKAHRIAYFLIWERDPQFLICHTCDNPPCCNPSHLFEGTNADNIQDCVKKNRIFRGQKGMKGEAHGRAKLTYKLADQIRRKYREGRSQVSLGLEYHVCKSTIGYIVNHKIWT